MLKLLMFQNSVNARIAEAAEAEDGATAVEYGLLVGLIGVAIIAVVGLLGDELVGMFDTAKTALDTADAGVVAPGTGG